MGDLSRSLMRNLCAALELPEQFFDDKIEQPHQLCSAACATHNLIGTALKTAAARWAPHHRLRQSDLVQTDGSAGRLAGTQTVGRSGSDVPLRRSGFSWSTSAT